MPIVNGDFRQNTLAVALIVGASAGGGLLYRGVSPPAQVGLSQQTIQQLTDRRQLELDQLRNQLTFQLQAMEQSIRSDMPPEQTRRRIRALEIWVQQKDPTFTPPTHDYSDF